ncbi:GNAT family N-acetyltransferase [Streptomyces sp. B6B3]|uniref:GNAT family N-acetyltransferase n=1 Tax=Streptomyces sp. B6B3 TaxID=3153570 RepID=UPI00325CB00D
MRTTAQPPYPAHWEADVVLRDGGTAHIRPITPADADRLVGFYERVSEESKYHRFFAPYPRLSARDVHRFTHHDFVDRVGLAATVGDDFIATVRFDRIDERGRAAAAPADRAEVAFLVQDAHQRRGLAAALLEHIAAVARERGVRRFVAEVLPGNSRMIKVFTDAGYAQRRGFADGSVQLTLDLAPTAESVAVMRAREQRAEARSVQRLLAPGSVAVIGAGRRPGGAGRRVLAALLDADFPGQVYAVNAALPSGWTTLGGAPAHRSIRDVEGPVDLAVLAVPADRVGAVLEDCGAHGVQGLVVMATGHTRDEQRALVHRARSLGMRILGPGAFGLINTAPTVRLNASPAPHLPRTGRIGLFTQSAAIGIAVLDELERCGAGLSTFVSAGNRADVSGNDVLQYWYEDRDTRVALMYLESLGNPRKFTRLARRAATAGTPVVVVRGGRHSGGASPGGHAVPAGGRRAPEATISALLGQAGVIQAGTATELVDTGLLLAWQPPPAGPRVAVLGNAEALALVAHDSCRAQGLSPLPVTALDPAAAPADYRRALTAALAAPDVHAAIVTTVPTTALPAPDPDDGPAPSAVALPAPDPGGPLRAAPGPSGLGPGDGPGSHEVAAPSRPHTGADAAPSGTGTPHASGPGTRTRGPDPRSAPHLPGPGEGGAAPPVPESGGPGPGTPARDGAPDIAAGGAGSAAALATALHEVAADKPVLVVHHAVDRLADELHARGIPAYPSAERAVRALAHAVRHAGWLSHAAAPGRVPAYDDIDAAAARRILAAAVTDGPATLTAKQTTALLDAYRIPVPEARGAAEEGVDTVVRATVDPDVGATLSFGLAGAPSELLGDVAHRLLPLTDRDAVELVRSIRAAPLLFGWRGARPVDVAGLEELLLRLGRLVEDHAELAGVELAPVAVAPDGVSVRAATVRVGPPPARADLGPRRLPAY